jgi:pSer/pThr/pTyr-binding forkhead associated (FHA) protein
MAARLQYLLQEIALPVGTFLIGRGTDCQLALDDPLVSRRHAAIRVGEESAFLEDLGSRNGAFLNGVRVTQSESLHDGDVIRIGSQDMLFYDNDETASGTATSNRVTTQPRLEGQLLEDGNEATSIGTSPFSSPGSGRIVSGLIVIGGLADKALALGRTAEAERILTRTLAEILERAQKAELAEPEAPERAAACAIRLAAATGKGAWVDYVFRLYTAIPALLPGRLVDELYAGVRKVKSTDKAVLRAYTTRLREIGVGFGPAERFIQQRIEGFERWAP